MWGAAEAPLPQPVTDHDDRSGSTTKMFAATVLVRLFFLRENPLLTVPPFYDHLVFRGVELKDCGALDLKFILRRRFERGCGFATRLNEKGRALSGDRKFHGGGGARINSDVFDPWQPRAQKWAI